MASDSNVAQRTALSDTDPGLDALPNMSYAASDLPEFQLATPLIPRPIGFIPTLNHFSEGEGKINRSTSFEVKGINRVATGIHLWAE